MAVITLSRQVGSGGDLIAETVARELGYKLVDKQEIHDAVATFAADFSKELSVLDSESRPGFFDRLFSHRSVYGDLIASIIFDYASKDNVVIKGRGGQYLFEPSEITLHIRIIAPF